MIFKFNMDLRNRDSVERQTVNQVAHYSSSYVVVGLALLGSVGMFESVWNASGIFDGHENLVNPIFVAGTLLTAGSLGFLIWKTASWYGAISEEHRQDNVRSILEDSDNN